LINRISSYLAEVTSTELPDLQNMIIYEKKK